MLQDTNFSWALSYVWGQHANSKLLEQILKELNEPIWVDRVDGDGDPRNFRAAYLHKKLLIVDTALIDSTPEEATILLPHTAWASRGWTWQEGALAREWYVYLGNDVMVKVDKLLPDPSIDIHRSSLELMNRTWGSQKDILFNLEALIIDTSISWCQLLGVHSAADMIIEDNDIPYYIPYFSNIGIELGFTTFLECNEETSIIYGVFIDNDIFKPLGLIADTPVAYKVISDDKGHYHRIGVTRKLWQEEWLDIPIVKIYMCVFRM
jgi:hypothetical protein